MAATMTEQEYEALEATTWCERWNGSKHDAGTCDCQTAQTPPAQSRQDARRAAEEAASAAAKMSQADADALATRLLGSRRSVKLLATDGLALETSEAGQWGYRGLYAIGTLADGRMWHCQRANSWGGWRLRVYGDR